MAHTLTRLNSRREAAQPTPGELIQALKVALSHYNIGLRQRLVTWPSHENNSRTVLLYGKNDRPLAILPPMAMSILFGADWQSDREAQPISCLKGNVAYEHVGRERIVPLTRDRQNFGAVMLADVLIVDLNSRKR
jgi:hypothetical protein